MAAIRKAAKRTATKGRRDSRATRGSSTSRKSSAKLEKQMAAMTADEWLNLLTGLGTAKDKRTGGVVVYNLMKRQEAEETFAADPIARKIVEREPKDATREWIDIEDMGDDTKKVTDDLKRLGAQAHFFKTGSWGRLYGGAALLMNVDDGVDNEDDGVVKLEEPLDLAKVKSLKNLVLFHRYELTVLATDINTNLDDANYGQPEFYSLVSSKGSKSQIGKIHHSRLIIFQGLDLPRQIFIKNGHWNDSALNAPQGALRDYNLGHDSVNHVLQDFRMLVYKIKDLAEAFATSEDSTTGNDASKALKERLEQVQLARSIIGAFVVDMEEDITVQSGTVAGVDKLLMAAERKLQTAVDMPHTILFNESPSGLGADGRSEERVWFDNVRSIQTTYYTPKLDQLFEVMMAAKDGPTGGQGVPEDFGFKWKALFQITEKEQAEIDKLQAEADDIRIVQGTLTDEEVREKRFPEAGKMSDREAKVKAEMTALTEMVTEIQGNLKGQQPGAPVPPAPPGRPPPPVPEAAPATDADVMDYLVKAVKATGRRAPKTHLDGVTRAAIQTIILKRSVFADGEELAAKWLAASGFSVISNAVILDSTCYPQEGPEMFEAGSFKTITLDRGVKAVIGTLIE